MLLFVGCFSAAIVFWPAERQLFNYIMMKMFQEELKDEARSGSVANEESSSLKANGTKMIYVL